MIQNIKYKKWAKIIHKSGLFDARYYFFTYPDVREQDIDPIWHYIKYGANEGRNPSSEFDTYAYLVNNVDIDINKINPLVHYILHGRKEGRIIQKVTKISKTFSKPIPKKIKINLIKENLLNQMQKKKLLNLQKNNNSKLAVVLHVYYPELIEEIVSYLNNIEDNYNLIITYPKEKSKEIRPFLNNLTDNRIEIEIENYGYDIFPFLKLLPILKEVGFKYFCKIHTKRDHDDIEIGKYWRESLVDGVLGSKKLVSEIIDSFEKDDKLYMIGSKINYVSYQATKYDNEKNVKLLAKELNIKLDGLDDFGFIGGSMFWGKVESFEIFYKTLKDCKAQQSFSGETSSIFHSYERVFGILTLNNKKIGLVDYILQYNNTQHVLAIPRKPEASILMAKTRYKAFRYKDQYLKYLLLIKSKLLDPVWCYSNNMQIKLWQDCIFSFLDKNIEYLSQKHKQEVLNLDFLNDKLIINYYDKNKEIIELESYHLCDNLAIKLPYTKSQKSDSSDITVSVIVTTYNHEKFIKQALKSIATQKTDFKFEILVGDDCSTDKTASIVQKMHKEYPDKIVPILRDKNIGPKNNHLDLFNKAKGKYIAINEGDDYWIDKNKLQTQVDYMENNKECSVCYHKVKVINENSNRVVGFFPPKLVGNKFSTDRLMSGNKIQTNSVMYRNNIFKNLILHPLLMPGDWYRHLLNSLYGEVHFLPNVMSVYRKHDGGIWTSLNLFDRQYHIGQIILYKDLDTITFSKFHNELIIKRLSLFKKLYWHYFEKCELDKLFKLITIDSALADLFSLKNNINIDFSKIKSKEELNSCYRKKYKISVVVTSYNHQDYIEQALENIITQKGFYALQLIVADDFSSDNTFDVITNYLKDYKKNEVIIFDRDKNLGMLQNMKKSFSVCKGEFVAICEGDDYWSDNLKLQKQLSFMLENNDSSMCFNQLLLEYVSKKETILHPNQLAIQSKFITFETILNTAVTANFSCCFYKTEAIKRVPTSYFEGDGADWLFNLYISTFGKVGFLKDVMSVYRIHENGQWSGLSKDEQYQRKQNAYKKHIELFPQHKDVILPLIRENDKREGNK